MCLNLTAITWWVSVVILCSRLFPSQYFIMMFIVYGFEVASCITAATQRDFVSIVPKAQNKNDNSTGTVATDMH